MMWYINQYYIKYMNIVITAIIKKTKKQINKYM